MPRVVKSNQQFVFIHDAICEGPIEGLVYGDSSVYLNDARLRDVNADSAFNPVKGQITFSGSTGAIQTDALPIQLLGTPENDNYLIIRGGTIAKSTTSYQGGVFTITGDTSFNSNYSTNVESDVRAEFKKIVLVDPLTETIILQGEGKLNGTDLDFVPDSTMQYLEYVAYLGDINDYNIELVESVKITTIASATSITTDTAPLLGNGSYSYRIAGSIAPNAEEGTAEAPAKLDNTSVQFRKGSTFQNPISELNGAASGTPYTANLGELNTTQLKQISEDDYEDFPVYKEDFYPEGEEADGVPITIEGSAVFSSLVAPLLDEVRVSIAYNSLVTINKENGDELSNTAINLWQIRVKKVGNQSFPTTWQNAFRADENVGQVFNTATTKSPISFEHYIDLEPFKPFVDFQIRVTRISRHLGKGVQTNGANYNDSTGDTDQGNSTGTISSITGINKDKFTYPYTAHAGVFLDSKEFSSVPKRSYELRGMKVRVPQGYIPREYANGASPVYPSFWDGSLSNELYYTDNPAWVFYDLIANDRFGVGEWIRESDVDLFALYRISKYCDELVPSGKKDSSDNDILEPRFRANIFLTKATDVYKVLKDMATIFTSIIYWMDGKMTTVLDAPGDPIYNFSKANVIDGSFAYESTGEKTRVNQVVVTWNDPEAGYEQRPLVVEDRNSIIQAGRIIKQSAFAFGCTSEGQARRYGKWKLFTAQGQTEIVSFKASLDGAFLKPGDIIQIQDSDRYGTKLSGRISGSSTSNNNSVIDLDRTITLNNTADYELTVLITEPAAFYAGTSTSIDDVSGTINKGDRVPSAWIDHNNSGDRTLQAIDTEEKASNAWTGETTGEPLPLTWSEHTYVESLPVPSPEDSPSQFTQLTTTGGYSSLPRSNSVWMLTETESGAQTVGSPDLYRILAVSQEEKNIYGISAVEHYNEKYDFIDNPETILDIPEDIYPTEPEVVVPPSQVYILQNSNAAKPNEEIIVQWDYPEFVDTGVTDQNGNTFPVESSRFLDGFELFHNIPNIENPITIGKRQRKYPFREVPDGSYIFRVRAISISENRSAWASARYLVEDPFKDNVNRNKGLQLEGLATQFPFTTNESASSGGHFRGDYDSAKGVYNSSTNTDGYRTGDIVLDSFDNYKYLPATGNVAQISTWEDYRGGLLKFRYDVSAILAPSRFRRSDAISLASNFTFDVNILRSESWLGVQNNNNRVAQVVLDHSTNSLRLIHARFDEALNMFYWYDLHKAMNEDNNTEVLKYWTNLPDRNTGTSGTVYLPEGSNKVVGTNTKFNDLNNLNKLYFSSSFGARVSYVESDTVLYLDRKAPSTFATGSTIYVQNYAPDFRKDVIIGRVSCTNNGRGSFNFENFLTLDPNLEGKRSILIDSNVSFLQYDPDENLTLSPDAISIQADAIGFDEPLFKVTYGDPSTAPLDENNNATIFEPEQVAFENPNIGIHGYSFNVWDGTETIPYDGGASYTIQVDVIEKEDQGNTSKAVSQSITIAKVGDVASASGGRSVFMELEDYSVIYNSGGTEPIYNGMPTDPSAAGNILFSATASPGFGAPIFRWKVEGTAIVPNPTSYPNATWYEAGGGGDLATYDWPVPGSLGDATNGFNWTNVNGGSKGVTVEVAEKPEGWTATVPSSGANTNEVTDDDIFAKDVDNILAIRANAGGLGINFVNDSHIIPCDAAGDVLTSANSGGSIEVFLGGQGVDYVASSPGPGEFTLGNISTTEDAVNGVGITVGTPTVTAGTNGPDFATIPDHTFTGTLDDTSNAGFETQEAITYPLTIMPHDGGAAITTSVTQVFTFVKNGAQSATGLVYLYSTGRTSSDLTAIDSSFKPVIVTMATGAVQHTAPTGFSGAVFQDSDYGYYTTATAATTNAAYTNADLWVVAATANSIADTYDAILYDEWTAPVQFSGTDGFNSATIEIFASNSDENSSPTLPGDTTYTFSPPGLSGTITPWSTTVPAPSRSNPYVWRSSAAAVSNTATAIIDGVDSGANSDGEDWSTPVLINRFVEDGITLELTNDTETVGADEGSAVTGLSVTTTAKVFQGGADVSNQWTFAASLPANLTCNGSTSTNGSVAGTGTNSNVFEVTRLETAYTNGNIQITATAIANGTYDGAAARSTNFTVSKINNGEQGVSYRIIPSVTAVSYTPTTQTHSPSGAITFAAKKIDPDGNVTAQAGYWSQTGGGSDTIDNTSAASSITVTPNTGSNATNNITVDFYLSYDSNTSTLSDLVDRETVPITADGNNGSAVDIWFTRLASGTPTVTVDNSGVPTGNVTWTTSIPSGTDQLWAVVIKKAINATSYTAGTPYKVNGTSVAEVYCFRRTTGGTALTNAQYPADSYYDFTNASFNAPTDWSKNIQAITTNQDRIYVSYAIATGTPETTNALLDWSTPVIYAIREDGVNTATITLHIAASSNLIANRPAPPDNDNTWTFETAAFASGSDLTNAAGNAWSVTEPALNATNKKYRWSCTQVVSGTGISATAAGNGWGTPEVTANFANDAYNQNTITLYKRNDGNSAPARPTTTSIWKFSTAAFTTAPNNGWTLTAPTLTSNLDTLWSCTQIASSQTDTDQLAGGNETTNGWSAQVVVGRFGTDGTKGDTGNTGGQGTRGPTGSQGTQGPTGSQGTRGPTGSQGTKGDTGDSGPTGAAFFKVTSNDNTTGAGKIASRINAAIGRNYAVKGDVCIVVALNGQSSDAYVYTAVGGPGLGASASNWSAAAAFISGDLVVDGTIGADQIAADSISARELTISSSSDNQTNSIFFDSSTTNGPSIKIYDGSGLRVKLGKL